MSALYERIKQLTRAREERQRAAQEPAPAPVNLQLHRARAANMRLRTYQVTGVQFLRETKRALLADAPGVGKTFQATEAAVLPCVISCPRLLVRQWETWIAEQYPTDPLIVAAEGDVIKRATAIETFKQQGGWLIVNHDMWRRFVPPPSATLIVDESHHFKNREAQRTKRITVYAHKATPRVYLLSATPVHKDASDLWAQLHMLDPQTWSSYWGFCTRHLVMSDYGYGSKVIRVKDQPALNRAIAPYLLERTARQVRLQLPESISKHVELTLDPVTRKYYNKLRDYYRYEEDGKEQVLTNAGAVLHALRRLLVTPTKINALKEIIDDTPLSEGPDGHARPVIVFTTYRETARKLQEATNELGGAITVTGDIVDAEKRRQLVLTGGPTKARIRICTIDSITEGIDASHARTVIFFEQTYIPGKLYQAMSRVVRHRNEEANDEPVVIYYLRYRTTIDDIIHRTVTSRTKGNALSVLKEALLTEAA